MKLGLDIHGVIDTNPKFFSELSNIAIDLGHEVHIITGTMITSEKIKKLKNYGMHWSCLFSISDYHKSIGTDMTFTDPNNPWIDYALWDKTKADYCENNKIDFHIDDSVRYGELFKTTFGLYDHDNRRIDWHLGISRYGAISLNTPYDCFISVLRVLGGNPTDYLGYTDTKKI